MPRCSDAQAQIRWGRCHWGSCCSRCTVMGRGWEEKRISGWLGLNTVLKGFIGVTRGGKSDFDMVWKLFRGSSLVLFSAENFSVARSKCCFTGCSTLPRTHFWGKTGRNHLLCHIACQSERGKELVSSLHGAFKKKIRPLSSPLSLHNHILPVIWVYLRCVFYHYFIHLSQIHASGEKNDKMAHRSYLLQITLFISTSHDFIHANTTHVFSPSLTLSSMLPSAFFFPFHKILLGFLSYLIGHSLHREGKTLGWREGRKKDNSLV